MNCCNSYGQCTGGPDCPARLESATPLKPADCAANGGHVWTPEHPQDLTLRDHAVILSLLTAGIAAGAALVIVLMTALHRWLA